MKKIILTDEQELAIARFIAEGRRRSLIDKSKTIVDHCEMYKTELKGKELEILQAGGDRNMINDALEKCNAPDNECELIIRLHGIAQKLWEETKQQCYADCIALAKLQKPFKSNAEIELYNQAMSRLSGEAIEETKQAPVVAKPENNFYY